MHVEWCHWSGQLNREMPLNRYGHAGLLIVMASGARKNETTLAVPSCHAVGDES